MDMWTHKSPRQKRRRAVFLLGALLAILGSFSVVLGVSATATFTWSAEHRLSAPIWGGIMVIGTGSATTYAIQRNKHKHLFYLLLGVSVAGMTVSFPQWILSLSGLMNGDGVCSESSLGLNNNHQDIPKDYIAAKALHGVCLVLGFAETLISFSLAILSSVGICDNGETSTSRLERPNRQSIRRSSIRASIGRARPAVVRLHLASGCRLNPPPQTCVPPPYPEPGPRAPNSVDTRVGPRAPHSVDTRVGPRSNTSPPPQTCEPPPYAAEPGPRTPQSLDTRVGPISLTAPQDCTIHDPPPPYRSREDLSQV